MAQRCQISFLNFLVSFQNFWFPSKIFVFLPKFIFWFPSKIFGFLLKFIIWFPSEIFILVSFQSFYFSFLLDNFFDLEELEEIKHVALIKNGAIVSFSSLISKKSSYSFLYKLFLLWLTCHAIQCWEEIRT